MWGEAIAIAAEGLDDIDVADGLELAAEGADTGGNDVAGYFVRTVISECKVDRVCASACTYTLIHA